MFVFCRKFNVVAIMQVGVMVPSQNSLRPILPLKEKNSFKGDILLLVFTIFGLVVAWYSFQIIIIL